MKLKVPGTAVYTTLTAPVLDISAASADGRYQGFVNVTSQVAAAGSGDYWVGDVQEATGQDRYGGWSLVVAYRDPTQPARNLTVFDGLQSVTSGTPPVYDRARRLQDAAGGPGSDNAGRRRLRGRSRHQGRLPRAEHDDPLGRHESGDNFFNSAISAGGVPVTAKSPNYRNQLGFDAILVNANGILPNGATSANITLKTIAATSTSPAW